MLLETRVACDSVEGQAMVLRSSRRAERRVGLGGVLFLGACLLMGEGCVNDSNGGSTPTPSGSPSSTSTTPPSEVVIVGGRLLAKSDVQTIPETPYDSGRVLAVPMGSRAELERLLGVEITPGHGPTTSVRLSAAAAELGHSSRVASDGAFTVTLPSAGDYLWLALNLGSASHPDPLAVPAFVYGWAAAEVPTETSEVRVDLVYDGEARRLSARNGKGK